MNILILYNEFNGAYGSVYDFQNEMIKTIKEKDCIYVSKSVKDTLEILRKYPIDFSIGIGTFYQYSNNVPIYEITKIHHYQWIIDNPLKMNIDEKSLFVTYIFIDKDFIYNLRKIYNLPLFIPLGFNRKFNRTDIKKKKEGIVFCGQIKDCEMNRKKIFKTLKEKKVEQFIHEYETKLDESLEKSFKKYFGDFTLSEQKKIFRLCNTYFRTKKRKIVIESIKDYPVYIIGDVLDDKISKKNNVHILSKMSYMKTWNEVTQYMFSLNINPNFHNAIHDRIIRSIQCGTLPITENGKWCYENFGDLIPYYDYRTLSIEDIIMKYDYKKYTENIYSLQSKAGKFDWTNALKKIKENYNEI